MDFFKSAFVCIGAAFVVLVATGCVTQRHGHFDAAFKDADKVQNGVLNREEFNWYLAGLVMERLDQDRNNLISLEEWRKANTSSESDKIFSDFDENGDARLSKGEISRAIARTGELEVMLLNFDQDRNGVVTPDELERMPVGSLLQIRF